MKLVIGNAPHHLDIHVASLKHSSTLILPPFDGWFASGADVPNGFAIEYRIHTASTSEVKTGTLHVKLDVERGSVTFPEA